MLALQTLNTLNPAWTAALAAVCGSAFAYFGAIKRLSGKVATSEAASLWEESREIRRDYLRRIEELNEVVENCQQRIDRLAAANEKLRETNGDLGKLVDEHERTIKELRGKVAALTASNETLGQDNARLKRRVRELEEASAK